MPPAIIAAGIGAGSLLGGALINKKSAANTAKSYQAQQQPIIDQQTSIAKQQQDMANSIFARSQPAFDQAYKYYSGVASGGPQLQEAVAPAANQINSQWDQAYKSIVNNAYSRGGSVDRAMRNVAGGRAMSLSSLYGGAQQAGVAGLAELGNAQGTGLTGLANASGSLSNAAATLASAQNALLLQQQQRSQALTGFGSILTRLLSTPGLFGGGGDSSQLLGPGGPGGSTNSIIGRTSGFGIGA